MIIVQISNLLDYQCFQNRILRLVDNEFLLYLYLDQQNYFLNKIQICEENRVKEVKFPIKQIQSIGKKETPLKPITQEFNFLEEIKKLPSDKYLEMTILPLVHTVILNY